jgi:pyruvate dehydrogenase E2 component (dihydrolipoamide acetyltransferase)
VVDDLVALRAELKPHAEERGVSLTYMPLVMKAVVKALKEFPQLNAMLDEEAEEILYKKEYHLGVAVATDAGLMVPVVRDVDRKGSVEIASDLGGLVERARDRKISREEMQGSTFTLTNFGAIGGEYATPIINYPEVAILGLGAIEQRPVVEDGEVVARHTLPLSLSIDHRVVDGADAGRFTNRVIEYLENPRLLLL